jgi:hypothetical protein
MAEPIRLKFSFAFLSEAKPTFDYLKGQGSRSPDASAASLKPNEGGEIMFWSITSVLLLLGGSIFYPAAQPGEETSAWERAEQQSVSARPAPSPNPASSGCPTCKKY